MSLVQMLKSTGAITSMARELGVDEGTATSAAGALLPAIVAGMGRSATGGTTTPEPLGGLGSLAGAILGGGSSSSSAGGALGGLGGMLGGALLDQVLGSSPTPTQPGNDILGNIFGSKDVSRSVAGSVAEVTGLDEGMLKKMLPILTMAVAGYMAKQASGGVGHGSPAASESPLGGILGSIVGGLMR
ncbi:MAG: DUF937 domain-containing protein [Pseudomonadota bacterium]